MFPLQTLGRIFFQLGLARFRGLHFFTLFFCATLLISGCQRSSVEQQESFVFGTRVDVTVAGAPADQAKPAIAAVLREFDRLHRQYHAWQPSELTDLNAAIAAKKPHKVSNELAGLIRQAQQLSAQGDHLFDPGIGRLIALWGFQSDEFKQQLPDQKDISAWLKNRPSIAHLTINGENIVRSSNTAVALDFGGYLKGWALDRAAEILHQHGIQNGLINIGGNILALGDKNGKSWRVGIQHPRQAGALATLDLKDGEAIGTSGDYQRFFELGDQRYPHLLDPRNGYPASHTQAVSILIPAVATHQFGAGTLSDACSKPIFIAGIQTDKNWAKMASAQHIGEVLRVNADGQVEASPKMMQRLQNIAPSVHIKTVDLSN